MGLGDTDAALVGHGERSSPARGGRASCGRRSGESRRDAPRKRRWPALAMQHMRGTAHAAAPDCPRQPGKLVATRSGEESPPRSRPAPRSGLEQQPPTLSRPRRCRLGPRGEAVPSCNASSGDREGAGRDKQLQKTKKKRGEERAKGGRKREREEGREWRGAESWDGRSPTAGAEGTARTLPPPPRRRRRRPPFVFLSNPKLVQFTTSQSQETKSGSCRPRASWRRGLLQRRARRHRALPVPGWIPWHRHSQTLGPDPRDTPTPGGAAVPRGCWKTACSAASP